jgi:LysM repeat protein
MALASQTSRSGSARGISSNQGGLGRFRRRKARARRRNFSILIVVVLAGFWWLVLRNPASTPTSSVAADDPDEKQAVIDPTRAAAAADRLPILHEAEKRVSAIPEPTRTPQSTPPAGVPGETGGAQANRPISVITMGERRGAGADPGASVGDSIADAIDRAKNGQGQASGGMEASAPPPMENASSAAPAIASMIGRAESAASRNRLVEARTLYNAALFDPGADAQTQGMLRRRITELNDTLLFSPTINADDPYTDRYEIQPGDALSKLPRKLGLNINWRFLQRINGISDPTRIRVGQQIKAVAGPFHAVISKSAFRMDLYMGESSELLYVASFPVGLGENDSTPIGSWVVRADSKLINPRWVNPRTGEVFDAENPKNPIGERWIGIEGIDERTKPLNGFGLHGTIDPGSIGTQASMGCIRLGDDDIALVYELLVEGVSRVEITP